MRLPNERVDHSHAIQADSLAYPTEVKLLIVTADYKISLPLCSPKLRCTAERMKFQERSEIELGIANGNHSAINNPIGSPGNFRFAI